MTLQERLTMAAAWLFGPLAALQVVLRPELGIVALVTGGAVYLATRSVAYPIGLAGFPTVVIGLIGTNPFPDAAVALFLFLWTAVAILLAAAHRGAVVWGALLRPAVVLSLLLAGWMLFRLDASLAEEYGSVKLQLFLAQNIALMVAAVIVGTSRRDFDLFVKLALFVATASALLITVGLATGGVNPVAGGRYSASPEQWPITLGRTSAEGLLIATAILMGASSRRLRFTALGALPLLGVSLVASGSRGPVVGLALGLVVLILLLGLDRLSPARILLLAGAVGAAGLFVSRLVSEDNVQRSFATVIGAPSGFDSTGRTNLWDLAWRVFDENFFTGLGTGSYAAIQPFTRYPHNLFLEMAAELGLPGLVLTGAIVLLGIYLVLRARALAREEEDRTRVAIVGALVIASITNAMFSADIQNNSAVWLAVGLAAGLQGTLLSRRRERESGPGPADP